MNRQEYDKNYNINHSVERKELWHNIHHKLKMDALTHYGNGLCSCVKCGFSNDLALCIDHLNGNGAEHRAKNGMIGKNFYRWLKTNNYPEGYQTLCYNCNQIKKMENKELKRNY